MPLELQRLPADGKAAARLGTSAAMRSKLLLWATATLTPARRTCKALQYVGNDAGVHEEALWELQRHTLGAGLLQPPYGLVDLKIVVGWQRLPMCASVRIACAVSEPCGRAGQACMWWQSSG